MSILATLQAAQKDLQAQTEHFRGLMQVNLESRIVQADIEIIEPSNGPLPSAMTFDESQRSIIFEHREELDVSAVPIFDGTC
jgi:hypothetical protein